MIISVNHKNKEEKVNQIEIVNSSYKNKNFKTLKVNNCFNLIRRDIVNFVCDKCQKIKTEKFDKKFLNEKMFCKKCAEAETMIERYGYRSTFSLKEVQEKSKQSVIKHYGVDHISKSDIIKQLIEETNIAKYGFKNPMQNEEVKNRSAKNCKVTCLEKYGVDSNLKVESIRQEIKKTNLEKYGFDYPLKSKVIRDKCEQTILRRYGVKNITESDKFRSAIKVTNNKKYGVDYPLQSVKIRDKVKETNNRKYGVDNPFKSSIIREKIKQTCLDKYGVEHILQNPEMHKRAAQAKGLPKWQIKIAEILNKNGNEWELEGRVDNYSVDILNKEEKIIIECFGIYWHADPKVYSSDYFNKTIKKLAKQIWEEDSDRLDYLRSEGYCVIVIWGSQWKKYKEDMINYIASKLIK